MFNLLIVDDEKIILNGIRVMITDFLEFSFPIKIETANNAPEAIKKLGFFIPDLILTDIRMPVMNGFELIETAKANGYNGDIVILTSHADFEYARTALRYGVHDFILKPIEQNSLFDIINNSYNQKTENQKTTKTNSMLHLLFMILYGLPASDLLLTEELLSSLFPHKYYTIIVIETELNTQQDLHLEEYFMKSYNICHCYYLPEKKQIIAICNHDTFFVKLNTLHNTLAQILYSPFLIGISISSTSIHKLHELYTNAFHRIFYQKAFGNDLHLAETASFLYHDCIDILLESNEVTTREKITHFLKQRLQTDNPNPQYLNEIYIGFFQNILLYLEKNGLPVHVELDETVKTSDDLYHTILNKVIFIKDTLKNNPVEVEFTEQVIKILNYISQHYQQDISLDDIADSVGLNPKYICTFLKKHTGFSYLTWLHKERIRVAKDLLSQNKLTIEQIANNVGYNSSPQLARVFRKYENMSPSDYRDHS